MGYELRRQLREVLGPSVTGLQRAVALEIADDASDRTRLSAVPLDDLVRWTGAKDASVVRNALKRLAAAGWEFRVPIGKGKDGRVLYAVPGRRMTYRVPDFQGVAVAPPHAPEGVATAHSEGAGATPYTPQGGAGAHSEGAGAHSEGAGATPSSSDPSAPSRRRGREGGAPATPSGERDYAWPAFGAFWTCYPRSKDIEKAKAAWREAIDAGAEPQQLVDAATAYARECAEAGTEPQFIKFPANWLREGRYHDQPDQPANGRRLRAVGPQTAPRDMTEEEIASALQFG